MIKNMEVLTAEDKRYLNTYSKYMLGMGTSVSRLTIWSFINDYDSIEDYLARGGRIAFDSGRNTDIPIFLYNILNRVAKYVDNNVDVNLDFCETDEDEPGNSLEINIDYEKKEISVEISCYYTTESNESRYVDLTVTEDSEDIIQKLRELFPNEDELVLYYNGGGDSGYVEDIFTNNESVPASVEDFCYRELEINFGGWEINEGSRGHFTFNLSEDFSIILHHIDFVQAESTQTLFEAKF